MVYSFIKISNSLQLKLNWMLNLLLISSPIRRTLMVLLIPSLMIIEVVGYLDFPPEDNSLL